MDLIIIFWFIIGTITSAIPAPFVKYYLKTDNSIWLILSAISYLILIFVYTVLLQSKDKNVTVIYSILKVSAILVTVGFDIFAFNSKFSTRSIIGIILAIVSVILLSTK
jgi:multidrug transporter EmrE-like cation transporter